MRPQDIPDFIFRGAVLSVDGREQTIRDFSLQTPLVNGQPVRGAQSLFLAFADGSTLEYDPGRVREIPGRLPAFIYEGARIFCKDPVPRNAANARFIKAANGEWEVAAFHFEKDEDDGRGRLRLSLKRPGQQKAILSRHFNGRTMTPCLVDPAVPVYELQNDLAVRRPLMLKRRT
jgi:hypothetical protein